MPPEQLPLDRKDFFKERKHERSLSDSPAPVSRWRNTSHRGPSRWASSDFRRLPGHGKQSGWHLFYGESGHGFTPSRSSEKILVDENCRSFGSRGDGNYVRYSRENRGAFGDKDWKGYSWDGAVAMNGLGKLPDVNGQRSADDILICNTHPPHFDFVNSLNQQNLKDQHDKDGGVSGFGTGQRFERENSLRPVDWKPLKWTRSGSLSSRGSGFSHSSSSKSIGVDSNEMSAAETRNVTPVQSPSGETTACVTSTAPLEETSSRKKPRLGWGEGLAKYEKKKVEGPDDGAAKNGMVFCGNNTNSIFSHASNLADKSPRVTGFSDCGSPATPSSVSCSSSPGLEDKQFVKVANVDNGTSNLCGSSALVSQNHSKVFTFNLENLDHTSIINLSSSISELLQSDVPSSVDSAFVRSTATEKLLVWKGDILKALEMTESEIDLLENELKSLISEHGSICPRSSASSSLPIFLAEPCEEFCAVSNPIPKPAPSQLVSGGDRIMERPLNAKEEEHGEVKDEDIDSPGTATSKFTEPVSLVKAFSVSDTQKGGEYFGNVDKNRSGDTEVKYLVDGLNKKISDVSACEEGSQLIARNKCATIFTDGSSQCDNILYDLILSSNKDSARRASEVFNTLLQINQCHSDFPSAPSVSYLQNDLLIKEKHSMRKRFLRFKERVLTLKFRAFQHLWKEDMHLLSIRKYRATSQKKFDISLRTVHNLHQRHRSSIRSRFSSPAGNLSLVANTQIINFASKLLSDSQVKPYRNTLKMPSLILDKKEKMISRFISRNGLVEDPCAVEKERSLMNHWTSEEKEIFIDKFATIGKDFKKISSFIDNKTTADCIEFYYKNHKSDCFEKTKKPEFAKQGKSYSINTYLVTSGKRWNREANAASLDMLGAASAIAANGDDGMEIQKCTSKYYFGMSSAYKTPRNDSGFLERSGSLDIFSNDRETVAADVLAGICGSLSSEAMSSCITSSVDPGEGYQDWNCQKMSSSTRRPLTPEVTQNVDDEICSDESCEEMDPADWTDQEKSIFIQAVSSYGKDFAMISQCVGTRSTDQCKVFFSKARKCLGLDTVRPGLSNGGTPVSDDDHGGGSDTEDACILETDSTICSEKLGCKIDEDMSFFDLKANHDKSDLAWTTKLQPYLNKSEENNVTGELVCKDTDIRAEKFVPDGFQVEEKMESELHADIKKDGIPREFVAVQVHRSAVRPSDSGGLDEAIAQGTFKALFSAGEVNDHGPPTRSGSEVQTQAASVVSAEHCKAEMEGRELLLPLSGLNDKQVENIVGNMSGASGSSSSLQGSDLILHSGGNASHLAADASSSGFDVDSSYQLKPALELDSARECKVIPLQQDNCVVTMNYAVRDSAPIQHEQAVDEHTSPMVDLEKIGDEKCQQSASSDDNKQHQYDYSLLDLAESSPILKGYPIIVPAKERFDCKKSVPIENISKLDRNFCSDLFLAKDCTLQKCNSSKHHRSVTELPFLSQGQTRDHPRPPLQSSTDVEKPCSNGDFKLFGQILTHPSPQQKPNPSTHGNEGKVAQHHKSSVKSFNLKFNGNQSVDGNSAPVKFDHNNLGVDNLPMKSYDFWDEHRIQTGFPSLSDSAILLAKYPAAFGNYSTSSSKMEQQPLHAVVNSSDRSLSGVSVLPTREISSSNGVADYQVYRSRDGTKVQPFTVDTQQRPDMFSEMQRRNGFDAVSSVQQQARGLVGINVMGREGGILVGGSCSGVSDPVAAIRMHYAKAEQYSVQSKGIMREKDSWRGKGDIDR